MTLNCFLGALDSKERLKLWPMRANATQKAFIKLVLPLHVSVIFSDPSKQNEAPPTLLIARGPIALKNWMDSFFEEVMDSCSAPIVMHNCPPPLECIERHTTEKNPRRRPRFLALKKTLPSDKSSPLTIALLSYRGRSLLP